MILAIIQGLIVLFLYFLGALVIGLALTPSILLFIRLLEATASYNEGIKAVVLGLGLAGGFFIFGLSLLLLVGFLNIGLNLRLKEGNYIHSVLNDCA